MDSDSDSEIGHKNQENLKEKDKNQGISLLSAEDEECLFNLIFGQCVKKVEYKSLLNFVDQKGGSGKSSTLYMTILAIINQPIDLNTRGQIIK